MKRRVDGWTGGVKTALMHAYAKTDSMLLLPSPPTHTCLIWLAVNSFTSPPFKQRDHHRSWCASKEAAILRRPISPTYRSLLTVLPEMHPDCAQCYTALLSAPECTDVLHLNLSS